MKILHLITGLEVGGAEMMLLNLLQQPSFAIETSRVISLTDTGVIGSRIRSLGIEMDALGIRAGPSVIKGLFRLIHLLRDDPPDLIQSWMYHADLLGSLATLFSGNIPIVWGIHHTLDGDAPVKKRTMRILHLNALLSRWIPNMVVCCAEAARMAHIRVGYFPRKLTVINNGVDTSQFFPHLDAPTLVRKELGLDIHTPLIGQFARFHPQKDHQTFIKAAGILHKAMSEVHFILAGTDITSENHSLLTWLRQAGVQDNTHLLGLRQDMPKLMSAVDIASLSSAYGEALPLSVSESMACGVPCVVTDIGDAALLVGKTGLIVPPCDPGALSAAWLEILSLSPEARQILGVQARSKISLEYNIIESAERYLSLYRSILFDRKNHGKKTTAQGFFI